MGSLPLTPPEATAPVADRTSRSSCPSCASTTLIGLWKPPASSLIQRTPHGYGPGQPIHSSSRTSKRGLRSATRTGWRSTEKLARAAEIRRSADLASPFTESLTPKKPTAAQGSRRRRGSLSALLQNSHSRSDLVTQAALRFSHSLVRSLCNSNSIAAILRCDDFPQLAGVGEHRSNRATDT